jgi:hypothetical protein
MVVGPHVAVWGTLGPHDETPGPRLAALGAFGRQVVVRKTSGGTCGVGGGEREMCPWAISINVLVIRCPTHIVLR